MDSPLRTPPAWKVGGSPTRLTTGGIKKEDDDEKGINVDFLLDSPHHWPIGLVRTIKKSKDTIAHRFFVLDNSQSMLTRDGRQLIDGKVIDCTRWEEVSNAVTLLAKISAATGFPTEIRLLNKGQVVEIGSAPSKKDGKTVAVDSSPALAEVEVLLKTQPIGQTPLCKHIRIVIDKIRVMEKSLVESKHVALLVLFTDGEATDGNVVDVLKSVERFPLKIVVRMCTNDPAVISYWQNINAQLDMDIVVLDDAVVEAAEVQKRNHWLTYGMILSNLHTYIATFMSRNATSLSFLLPPHTQLTVGEPLHRAREFGVMVPEFDILRDRQLTKTHIKTILESLFTTAIDRKLVLPNPNSVTWDEFMKTARKMIESAPVTHCPLLQRSVPWVNLRELSGEFSNPYI